MEYIKTLFTCCAGCADGPPEEMDNNEVECQCCNNFCGEKHEIIIVRRQVDAEQHQKPLCHITPMHYDVQNEIMSCKFNRSVNDFNVR